MYELECSLYDHGLKDMLYRFESIWVTCDIFDDSFYWSIFSLSQTPSFSGTGMIMTFGIYNVNSHKEISWVFLK